MAGKFGKGAEFRRDNGSGVYGKVSNVTKIKPYELKADGIDVTDHDSVGDYREYVAGLLAAGKITLDLNYDPDHTTHRNLEADNGVVKNYQIKFRGGRLCTMSAFIDGVSPELPSDNKMTCSATLQISGLPVWS